MRKLGKYPWALLLFTALILQTACSPASQPVEGVITNYETGEPVPDAYVAALWTGTAGGLGHGGGAICFHVEVTKTDENGRYHIPAPEIRPEYANYPKPRILIISYKQGYRWAEWVNGVPSPWDQLIETDETSEARMHSLHDVIKNTHCDQAGDGDKNLLPLYEALYADAEQAVKTKEDKKYSYFILNQIEDQTLGGEEALERYYERTRNLR